MVNNNTNLPAIEEVREIKDQVPSFEEFMQSYEHDENLNYADLSNDDIGEAKGYGPCSYNGRNLDMCRSLSCAYFLQIVGDEAGNALGNTTKAAVGTTITAASTAGWIAALMATPFTGGASLAAAAGLSACASVSAVTGTALTVSTLKFDNDALKRVENELKSKWEEEKRTEERVREKTRKINSLKGQLDEAKRELERAIEKMDMCKSDNDYTREKKEKERLENKVRNLKSDLCREKGCGCGGYYCL